MEILNILTAITLDVILLYWSHQEKKLGIDKSRSGHKTAMRIIIRAGFPLLGALLILQLVLAPPTTHLPLFIIGHIIFWLSVILAFWTRQTMANNWAHAADYQIFPQQKLVTTGPFRYIRHPIYVAFLLLFAGIELALQSYWLLLVIPLSVFVYKQAKREEKLLESAFGDTFKKYKQRTRMFVPFVA